MERIFLYSGGGPGGRNYIKQIGTKRDIDLSDIKLKEGMRLNFYCDDADDAGKRDDLYFEGVIHFDSEKQQWYVLIDERTYHHASDLNRDAS